jgi:hypothetical protein
MSDEASGGAKRGRATGLAEVVKRAVFEAQDGDESIERNEDESHLDEFPRFAELATAVRAHRRLLTALGFGD